MGSYSKTRELPLEWEEIQTPGSSSPEIMTAEVDPSMALSNGAGSELPYDMSEWSAEEIAAYNALRSKRKKCCVGGCTPRSLPIARSYHQLPVRNQEIWAKWVEIIRWSRNDPDWSPNGDAAPLVCSRHFPDSDFISYEASSRVRLSHTAIPMYFVDMPEGTEVDPRFSNPLPVPAIATGGRIKVISKPKKEKPEVRIEETPIIGLVRRGSNGKYESLNNASHHQQDIEYGYDIEEVNEEAYDNTEEPDEEMEDDYYEAAQIVCKPELSFEDVTTSRPNRARLSAPPSLINYQNQNQRNFKINATASKPPGLIRANFSNGKELFAHANIAHHQLNPAQLAHYGSNSILKKDIPAVVNRTRTPTKHKIGLAKCRLIVQTLENQLKIAKTRLAEQLDIPYQVVHGVWNMRDTLKDKL